MGHDASNADERLLNEFLLTASQEARGDVEKKMDISSVRKKMRTMSNGSQQFEQMLYDIASKNFITRHSKETFSVTYPGIYYISKAMNQPIESLGILSEKDVKKIIGRFNRWIYEESLKDETRTVKMVKLEEEFGRLLGGNPSYNYYIY